MFTRKEPLPPELHAAWWSFLDCAAVIEGGIRQLLACLPVGRVEPAPIGIGVDALQGAIHDARGWMDDWRLDDLADAWDDAQAGMAKAEAKLVEVREVAATTGELEELQETMYEAIGPLDALADAERAWRRRWKVPRDRERPVG